MRDALRPCFWDVNCNTEYGSSIKQVMKEEKTMISKEFTNDSFKKEMIESTTHSMNQFTTIKYRWSALSMVLVGVALSLILSLVEVQSNRMKLILAVSAGVLLGMSFAILRRSTKTVNSNNIHGSME
jgi:uncharacterized membrane protein